MTVPEICSIRAERFKAVPYCTLLRRHYSGREGKTKAKGGKDVSSPPKAFLLAFFNVYDLAAIVLTAGLASTMGHTECAAAGALYDAGDSELPCGRTSLITSLS